MKQCDFPFTGVNHRKRYFPWQNLVLVTNFCPLFRLNCCISIRKLELRENATVSNQFSDYPEEQLPLMQE